jgi:hypothetical protein
MPRPRVFLLAALVLLAGCRHLDRQYAKTIDDLVTRKAAKSSAALEFGAPVSSTLEGNRETVVFIPVAKTSRRAVTKIVNGVETKEETVVSTPGKLKVTMVFVAGCAVGGAVSPVR